MFGFYRFLLAIAVVVHHTYLYKIGAFAVFAFFTLSGFLMTLLMCETYKDRRVAFALNRFLRIYHQYWFTMVMMAGLVYSGLPSPSNDIGILSPSSDIGVPSVANLLFDIAYINYWKDKPQLVLTAWAVTNELVFYVLIGLGLSSNKKRTLLWFKVSLVTYALVHTLVIPPSDLFYFSPIAASLPFSLGALAFHYRNSLNQISPALVGFVSGFIMLTSVLIGKNMGANNPLVQLPFFLGASVLTLSLYLIGNRIRSDSNSKNMWERVDNTVGMLSYPMYLNHFGAIILILPWIPSHTAHVSYTALVIITSILLSIVSVYLIDKHINRIRKQVRLKRH